MADIVLRDRNGKPITYPGITEIKVNTADGGTQNFVAGDAVEATVDLDFSSGDMSVFPGANELFSEVIISQPETLTPENIVKNVVVAGIVGSYEVNEINLDSLTELFPVTEFTVPSDGMVPIPMPIGLEVGSIYLVLWNSVGYICKAQSAEFQGMPVVAIGNLVAVGGENTGEPFAIGEFPEEIASQMGGVYGGIIPLDGSTSFKAGSYFVGGSGTVLEDLPIKLDFSNGNQKITADAGYLVKSAVIEKPTTLVPENIAKDVNIAGIVGTHESGGVPRLKPIRFYDPYGNILYSFTRAEIKEMTELPPGPELEGLTFSKWTHTLSELKAVPYFADVGPCYKQNGTDVLALVTDVYYQNKINNSSHTMYLAVGTGNACTVNWGDGSTTSIGSSTSNASHAYTTPGRYIVTIKPSGSGTVYLQLGYYTSNYYYQFYTSTSNASVYNANINAPGNLPLVSVLNGLSIPLRLYGCTSNAQLKLFSSYSNVIVYAYGLMNNPNLVAVCAKNLQLNGSLCCARNLGLKRYPSLTNIPYDYVIDECRDLEEVIYSATPDKLSHMNDRWSMLMTNTTPPTLTASTVRTWGTKPIYVPDSALSAYKTADVWNTVANYIYPASQYPD